MALHSPTGGAGLGAPTRATIEIADDDRPPCVELLADGTFEAGDPWPAWTIQTSTVFGSPLCDTDFCGTDATYAR